MTTVWLRTLVLTLALAALPLAGCGDDDDGSGSGGSGETSGEGDEGEGDEGEGDEGDEGGETATAPEVPDNLPTGLLLAYAQFVVENGSVTPNPGPAQVEILTREGGEWKTRVIEDETAAVFHKAFVYQPDNGGAGIVTLSGTRPVPAGETSEAPAAVKLWRPEGDGFSAATLWSSTFGGRVNRMRDAEVGDVDGDGKPDIAIGTHDQGVVALLTAGEGGGYQARELDRQEEATFIHEIELGDLNGDGVIEIYATPSEPNTLEGDAQHGEVVRFVPKANEGRQVVADLGNRHAKEILVDDVDGDGTDELYVAVEALTEGRDPNVRIVEPVEIRRYDADTPADQGVVIARIDDRFTRFLTAGDVDGDGKKELVAAAYSSGLWLLRPGSDPRGEWAVESIDRDSSGFEHAALFADLDGDGTDELYVAADEQGELRRYVWVNDRPRREVIHRREHARSKMTWNIMPIPLSVLGAGG